MKQKNIVLFALLALFSGFVFLQGSSGKSFVDKQLPKIKSLKWLNGKPEYEGKPMVVEFWATWCPPCRKSIPHLNELHAKFKDEGLVIIGISNEEKKVVKDFQKNLPMDYFSAVDEKRKYTEQFGIRGIPHALLVDKDGKVVWEGHPMSLSESAIKKVL